MFKGKSHITFHKKYVKYGMDMEVTSDLPLKRVIVDIQTALEHPIDPTAFCVQPRGYGVIDKYARIRRLGTSGYGPCCALMLAQPGELLVVAHFDNDTDVDRSVKNIMGFIELAQIADPGAMPGIIEGADMRDGSANLKKAVLAALQDKGITSIRDLGSFERKAGRRTFVADVNDGIMRYGVTPAMPQSPQRLQTRKGAAYPSLEKRPLWIDYSDVRGQIIQF